MVVVTVRVVYIYVIVIVSRDNKCNLRKKSYQGPEMQTHLGSFLSSLDATMAVVTQQGDGGAVVVEQSSLR